MYILINLREKAYRDHKQEPYLMMAIKGQIIYYHALNILIKVILSKKSFIGAAISIVLR